MARSLFLLFLLCVSGAAAAQYKQNGSFRYSYIEASYSKADYDNLNSDGDGLGVGVSLAVANNFHVFGSYAGADLGSSVDASGWKAGLGLSVPLTQLMDVVVQGFYQSTVAHKPLPDSLRLLDEIEELSEEEVERLLAAESGSEVA